VWDLIRHLSPMLASDIAALGSSMERESGDGLVRLGSHDVIVERGATVEPFVVFDATPGPILLRRGAHITAFTKLVGPCAIGEHTIVNGGKIANCSIGDHCRATGELSTTIFLGHANKGHDGFVGHSYLGRWVNLGASTVTSNLKNTYGSVAFWTPDGIRETGLQFLGTFFGDHAKTAIGTRLTTGSVIGAGANVFGGGMTPKVVPPFAWGIDSDGQPYALDRFLVVAERMMERRHVPLGDRGRKQLSAAHARGWRGGT
jgi:UDP-N-acetylglucosamine diphosphorylase / glucose-1-phosphate thymidylyltransferase / UDP-N-acetylgalactosamine diphosphorylase / glucosamine-1-phosphate N-acetyltransferase / galactosamine-1-phosphate N-acetyltransferase